MRLDNGRRKSLYGKTRQEVTRKLAQAVHERNQGILIARDERQTLATYLRNWLETVRPTVEPSTWERYEVDVRCHLIPCAGQDAACETDAPTDTSLARPQAQRRPRTAHRVEYIRAVLRQALNEAQALGLVTRNAAALVRAPKAPRGELHVYHESQVRALLTAAAGTRLEVLLTLAVTTGMRERDLLGFRWRHDNLDRRYLQVQTQLRRLQSSGLTIKDVNTGSSRRKIELSDVAVGDARRTLGKQSHFSGCGGYAWGDEGTEQAKVRRYGMVSERARQRCIDSGQRRMGVEPTHDV